MENHQHLYLKDNGEVKDALTSFVVGTWHNHEGIIHIFIYKPAKEVKHERPATHKSVMAEHNGLNRERVKRTVKYDPKTMKFESHITVL